MSINCKQARQISIVDYLERGGFSPQYVRGNNHWYLSPLRNEKTPSFKVDSVKNTWYDFGTGEGGNLVDLGVKLQQCSVEELLLKLSQPDIGLSLPPQTNKPPIFELDNKVVITGVAELHNRPLLDYLKSRSITADIARQFCKEVGFSISGKSWMAIGFPNRSGGWELRNQWFKGTSTPKDISYIPGDSKSVYVTEGFMDFLSLVQLRLPEPDVSFLILNSAALIGRSLDLLRPYPECHLFLDRDNSGYSAASILGEAGLDYTDRSTVYRGFKDLNDYLQHAGKLQLKPEQKQQQSKGYGSGHCL